MKIYALDTNVLLEDPNCIARMIDEGENKILIPYNVILELDKFKHNPKFRKTVRLCIDAIRENKENVLVLPKDVSSPLTNETVDTYILDEIREASSEIEEDITLVSNDGILRLLAREEGFDSEEYIASKPVRGPEDMYTGVQEEGAEGDPLPNSFSWANGTLIYHGKEEKPIMYQNSVWNVEPRSVYQNMMMELLLDPNVDLLTVQSEAGYGKSFLAMAAALHLTLQKKEYEKIFVVKPTVELGAKLGFLPGGVDEKIAPYNRYMVDILMKLHAQRPANRLFMDPESKVFPPELNNKYLELLPITYVRGLTIENAVIIIDEVQNLSRGEARAVLSRMGENVKCICLGDTKQVDTPNLDEMNNGLSWIIECCKGAHNYAHLVLKGNKSRGPICDLIRKAGL